MLERSVRGTGSAIVAAGGPRAAAAAPRSPAALKLSSMAAVRSVPSESAICAAFGGALGGAVGGAVGAASRCALTAAPLDAARAAGKRAVAESAVGAKFVLSGRPAARVALS